MNNLLPRGSRPPPVKDKSGADWHGVMNMLWIRRMDVLRSSAIGTAVGILPGAGADIAAYTAAAASGKGRSGHAELATEEKDLVMVADATAANNAALAGAWIPALVLGIPGDSITAIAIGVLMMKNVTPGPNIFVDQPTLIYGIYIAFLVSNLIMLPVGLFAIRVARQVMRVPLQVLMPVIGVFCVVGSYSINGSYFDVAVMAAMGAVGFAFDRLEVPLAPVVLGIILGGPLEERFIQTWTGSNGNLLGFVDRPGSFLIAVLLLGAWVWAGVRKVRRRGQTA
jgi:TctA family transporter